MKTIDEDIRNGQFQSVYLLCGEEAYLKKQYKDKLKRAMADPDDSMNFSAYEGKGINPKEVIDLAETLPFFADRRVILIENSGFFKNSCEELAEYMPQVPETTHFIFVEDEIDKRSKLYKAVKNAGKIVEFTSQTEELLTRWVLTRIKKEGKNLAWSLKRAVDIPSLAADFLQGCMKGQTKINLDLHASDDLAWLLRRLVRNIVMGLWVMALLISSSIICTTDMKPKLWGIPALGAFGYVFAFIIVLYVFIKHFFSGK